MVVDWEASFIGKTVFLGSVFYKEDLSPFFLVYWLFYFAILKNWPVLVTTYIYKKGKTTKNQAPVFIKKQALIKKPCFDPTVVGFCWCLTPVVVF